LALHEILAGPAFPIHLPVPWARHPELNHLRPPEEVRELLEETGFKELAWIGESDTALRWHKERLGAVPEKPSPLGLHLVPGDYLGALLRNRVRNLEERRISIARAVLEPP
jgi:hypothetical protein